MAIQAWSGRSPVVARNKYVNVQNTVTILKNIQKWCHHHPMPKTCRFVDHGTPGRTAVSVSCLISLAAASGAIGHLKREMSRELPIFGLWWLIWINQWIPYIPLTHPDGLQSFGSPRSPHPLPDEVADHGFCPVHVLRRTGKEDHPGATLHPGILVHIIIYIYTHNVYIYIYT